LLGLSETNTIDYYGDAARHSALFVNHTGPHIPCQREAAILLRWAASFLAWHASPQVRYTRAHETQHQREHESQGQSVPQAPAP